MLQNTRVTAFTISELLKENQQEVEGVKITPTPSNQIRVNQYCTKSMHLKQVREGFYVYSSLISKIRLMLY